jgi:hypothetical protein
VDSLAAAQIAARRAAGIREESAERSRTFGATLARAVLALRAADAQRTLVLRHPQECVYRVAAVSSGIVPQGAAAAAAIIPVLAAAESRLLEALVAADSVAAATRRAADDAACVRALVQGRIRTRAAAP